MLYNFADLGRVGMKKGFLRLAAMFATSIVFFSGCGMSYGNDIKIGIIAPMSGKLAQYGEATSNGAELYLDEVNKSGGIEGKQIKYIKYDEEGDPSKATTGFNLLCDKGITALIGDMPSIQTMAVAPIAHEARIPMITPSATAREVTYDAKTGILYDNVFRACFLDSFQGEKMAEFASERLNAKTAAVLYCTENDHSLEAKTAFVKKSAELGIDILSTEGFSTDAVDFQGQLANISARKPDCLFIPYYYGTVALIAPQARAAGITCPLLGTDGWDSVMSVVGDASTLEGAYYCAAYSTDDTSEIAQHFLTTYREKYGSEPNMFAAEGYDAAKIMVNAITSAVNLGLQPGTSEFREAVVTALKATDVDCVTGHIEFDEFNNPRKETVIIKISGGKANFLEKF
jgi:branched-chain amino acid transport system substrate-binding protein